MAAAPRLLRLREFGRASAVELSPEEVRVLRESRAEVKVVATGVPNRYDIETAQHVGTIVGPALRVLIEPKVAMSRVLYLMGFAPDALRFAATTRLAPDADLLDVMQLLYAEALDRALYGGLVREYREQRDALVAPRGRLDAVALWTRRFGVFPPIDCTFTEFSADTEANRRLLAAIRRLTRGSLARTPAGARLRALADRFEEVADARFDARSLEPLRLDRRAARYAAALSYADLVLRNASIELHHGETDAVGFLVDMNVVFENFVVGALGRHLADAGTRWTHHPSGLFLDEDRAFSIDPDALWSTADGAPMLVLDAKYKTTERGVIQDAYQMLAYCTALGLRRGVLVYAAATPQAHRVRNTDTEIVTVALDPAGDPAEIEKRVAALAAEIRELATAPAVAAT